MCGVVRRAVVASPCLVARVARPSRVAPRQHIASVRAADHVPVLIQLLHDHFPRRRRCRRRARGRAGGVCPCARRGAECAAHKRVRVVARRYVALSYRPLRLRRAVRARHRAYDFFANAPVRSDRARLGLVEERLSGPPVAARDHLIEHLVERRHHPAHRPKQCTRSKGVPSMRLYH